MKLLRWLEAGILYFVILGALLAGLAAAYGREREALRDPGRRWWINRLLILPVLGITSAAAAETLSLSLAMAAFATAMLTMGGYEALRWIEAGIRHRAEGLIKAVDDQALVAIRAAHRPTAGLAQQGVADPRARPLEALRDVIPLNPVSLDQQVLLSRIPEDEPMDILKERIEK
ncbi:MAG TPA: hypothetical protein VF582_04850 [Allosphingosinicella sp.]